MTSMNDNINYNSNDNDFPITDKYHDCAGKHRTFEINAQQLPMGWIVTAIEKNPEDAEYEFRAFSESNPYIALGEIRSKIRRALSVKYLNNIHDTLFLTHDKLSGIITYDRDTESHGFLVDGKFISMDESLK